MIILSWVASDQWSHIKTMMVTSMSVDDDDSGVSPGFLLQFIFDWFYFTVWACNSIGFKWLFSLSLIKPMIVRFSFQSVKGARSPCLHLVSNGANQPTILRHWTGKQGFKFHCLQLFFCRHCTMQPSIAIGIWNFFESYCLVCAHFWSKWDKIFWTGVKP